MQNKRIKQTKNWRTLNSHKKSFDDVHMRDLFAEDKTRADRFSITLDGLHLDYSKNPITAETIDHLVALAEKAELGERIQALFNGERINYSENRAALHPALRGSTDDITMDGERVSSFVEDTKARMRAVSDKIRNTPNITDVVHIGIGGSNIGPRLACQALAPFADGPRIHFVSNVDGAEAAKLIQTLIPQNTVLIIASKTFTTSETMTNAKTFLNWLEGAAGPQAIDTQVIALTMNENGAFEMGISSENILPLRNWIGGRYSLWSAIGLPIALSCGFDVFQKLLDGARMMDHHFRTAEFAQNIPVILAMLGIWHRNFWGHSSYAVLPYAQGLEYFPTYIQQLDMESNGKSVDVTGQKVHFETAPVVFGLPGTNCQHTFLQAIHQGSDIIPCDFIMVAYPEHGLAGHHKSLLANALAQSQALMQGKESNEGHREFSGNRPSSTIILDRLDAYHLGMLLALYEHKTFTQGIIWNINSFDQWGVELGKTLSKTIHSALRGEAGVNAENMDTSTGALINYLRHKI